MSLSLPHVRELDRDEMEALLRRHTHGRIAFLVHDQVDIEPIHYVYQDGWLIGRTGQGTKLSALAHHPWVAFEVDEVEGPFSWRSVVVKGTVYLVHDEASARSGETAREVRDAIRALIPDAFGPGDPFRERSVLFRLHADVMTGRAASSGTA
jgi:uncharacterized protein